MSEKRFDRLTDGQRDCLRLFHARMGIKRISVELKIAVPTVNQRLAKARQILGVGSSQEAARLLHDHEARQPAYIGAIHSENPLPQPIPSAPSDTHEVRQEAAVSRTRIGFPWPFPTRERRTNTFSLGTRLLWTGLIALTAVVVMFGIGLATLGLQDVIALLTGQRAIPNATNPVQGMIT